MTWLNKSGRLFTIKLYRTFDSVERFHVSNMFQGEMDYFGNYYVIICHVCCWSPTDERTKLAQETNRGWYVIPIHRTRDSSCATSIGLWNNGGYDAREAKERRATVKRRSLRFPHMKWKVCKTFQQSVSWAQFKPHYKVAHIHYNCHWGA